MASVWREASARRKRIRAIAGAGARGFCSSMTKQDLPCLDRPPHPLARTRRHPPRRRPRSSDRPGPRNRRHPRAGPPVPPPRKFRGPSPQAHDPGGAPRPGGDARGGSGAPREAGHEPAALAGDREGRHGARRAGVLQAGKGAGTGGGLADIGVRAAGQFWRAAYDAASGPHRAVGAAGADTRAGAGVAADGGAVSEPASVGADAGVGAYSRFAGVARADFVEARTVAGVRRGVARAACTARASWAGGARAAGV